MLTRGTETCQRTEYASSVAGLVQVSAAGVRVEDILIGDDAQPRKPFGIQLESSPVPAYNCFRLLPRPGAREFLKS